MPDPQGRYPAIKAAACFALAVGLFLGLVWFMFTATGARLAGFAVGTYLMLGIWFTARWIAPAFTHPDDRGIREFFATMSILFWPVFVLGMVSWWLVRPRGKEKS